jgi:hypothetical protein
MTETERLAWVRRLEIEAFGQERPEVAAYGAFLDKFHAMALTVFFGGFPVFVLAWLILQNFLVFLVLFCLFYVGIAVLSFSLSRGSDLWRWYFSGHVCLRRLSAIPPLATWKELQASAAKSDDPQIRNFASRSWTDYQTALTAFGRPASKDTALSNGFQAATQWLSFLRY